MKKYYLVNYNLLNHNLFKKKTDFSIAGGRTLNKRGTAFLDVSLVFFVVLLSSSPFFSLGSVPVVLEESIVVVVEQFFQQSSPQPTLPSPLQNTTSDSPEIPIVSDNRSVSGGGGGGGSGGRGSSSSGGSSGGSGGGGGSTNNQQLDSILLSFSAPLIVEKQNFASQQGVGLVITDSLTLNQLSNNFGIIPLTTTADLSQKTIDEQRLLARNQLAPDISPIDNPFCNVGTGALTAVAQDPACLPTALFGLIPQSVTIIDDVSGYGEGVVVSFTASSEDDFSCELTDRKLTGNPAQRTLLTLDSAEQANTSYLAAATFLLFFTDATSHNLSLSCTNGERTSTENRTVDVRRLAPPESSVFVSEASQILPPSARIAFATQATDVSPFSCTIAFQSLEATGALASLLPAPRTVTAAFNSSSGYYTLNESLSFSVDMIHPISHINASLSCSDAFQQATTTSLLGSLPALSCAHLADTLTVPLEECVSLAELYYATNGAEWTQRDGWLAHGDVGSWFGVFVVDGGVRRLDLGGNGLVGVVPELGGLSLLSSLVLSDNVLSGFSGGWGGLEYLHTLRLDGNVLSGDLLSGLEVLDGLWWLSLEDNPGLSGRLADELCFGGQELVPVLHNTSVYCGDNAPTSHPLQVKGTYISGVVDATVSFDPASFTHDRLVLQVLDGALQDQSSDAAVLCEVQVVRDGVVVDVFGHPREVMFFSESGGTTSYSLGERGVGYAVGDGNFSDGEVRFKFPCYRPNDEESTTAILSIPAVAPERGVTFRAVALEEDDASFADGSTGSNAYFTPFVKHKGFVGRGSDSLLETLGFDWRFSFGTGCASYEELSLNSRTVYFSFQRSNNDPDAVNVERIQQLAACSPGAVWHLGGELNRFYSGDARNSTSGIVRYVALFERYSEEILRADPSAKIMGPSMFHWDTQCIYGCAGQGAVDPVSEVVGAGAYFTRTFVDLYEERNGQKPPVDIWSITVYPADWYGTINRDVNELVHVDWPQAVLQVAGMREYVRGALGSDAPIWITEFGNHWPYSQHTLFQDPGRTNGQPFTQQERRERFEWELTSLYMQSLLHCFFVVDGVGCLDSVIEKCEGGVGECGLVRRDGGARKNYRVSVTGGNDRFSLGDISSDGRLGVLDGRLGLEGLGVEKVFFFEVSGDLTPGTDVYSGLHLFSFDDTEPNCLGAIARNLLAGVNPGYCENQATSTLTPIAFACEDLVESNPATAKIDIATLRERLGCSLPGSGTPSVPVTAEVGESCDADVLCVDGASCLERECVLDGSISLGNACTIDVQCASGTLCDSEAFLCKSTPGNDCTLNDDCVSGSSCRSDSSSQGMCVADGSVEKGEACTATKQCVASARCDIDGSGQCRTVDADACTENADCFMSSSCLQGVCVAPNSVGLGAVCTDDMQCEDATCGLNSQDVQVCVANSSIMLEERCTTNAQCVTGAICDVSDTGTCLLDVAAPVHERAHASCARINTTLGVPFNECLSLAGLYHATDGNNWENNTGWLSSTPVSDWFGVFVVDGGVRRLDLGGNGLVGVVPELGGLSLLSSLVLSDNVLSGFSGGWGGLEYLHTLRLDGNVLSGDLLSGLEVLDGLWWLSLEDNPGLSGRLADELCFGGQELVPVLHNTSVYCGEVINDADDLFLKGSYTSGVVDATVSFDPASFTHDRLVLQVLDGRIRNHSAATSESVLCEVQVVRDGVVVDVFGHPREVMFFSESGGTTSYSLGERGVGYAVGDGNFSDGEVRFKFPCHRDDADFSAKVNATGVDEESGVTFRVTAESTSGNPDWDANAPLFFTPFVKHKGFVGRGSDSLLETLGFDWRFSFGTSCANYEELSLNSRTVYFSFHNEPHPGSVNVTRIEELARCSPGAVWHLGGELNRFYAGDARDSASGIVRYVALFERYSEEILRADPSAKIMGPSMFHWDTQCIYGCRDQGAVDPVSGVVGAGAYFTRTFVDLYEERNGQKPPVDIWSITVYPADWYGSSNSEAERQELVHVDWPQAVLQVAGMREYVRGELGSDAPIWITEFGNHWPYASHDFLDEGLNPNIAPRNELERRERFEWELTSLYMQSLLHCFFVVDGVGCLDSVIEKCEGGVGECGLVRRDGGARKNYRVSVTGGNDRFSLGDISSDGRLGVLDGRLGLEGLGVEKVFFFEVMGDLTPSRDDTYAGLHLFSFSDTVPNCLGGIVRDWLAGRQQGSCAELGRYAR